MSMSRERSRESKPSAQSGGINYRHRGALLVSAALVISALSTAGCSSGAVNSSAGDRNTDLGALNYFPIDVGYSASYVVTDANSVELRRESYSADSAVVVNGRVGVDWVQRNLADSSVLSRGAMTWNSDQSVLFHSEDSSQSAERLLRTPLSSDAQWPRWHEPLVAGGGGGGVTVDSGTGQTGADGGLGVDTSGGGANGANVDNKDNPAGVDNNSDPQLSSFPTQGASTFYVASLSDDLIINGKTYEDCLQIVNANPDQTVNRYWYCPGVGLVQYALKCNPGETVGVENGAILN